MIAIYLNSIWLAGIFFGSLFLLPHEFILSIAVLAFVALWRWGKCSPLMPSLCLVVFVVGIARYDSAAATANTNDLSRLAEMRSVTLRGVVIAEPEVRERNTNAVVSVREALTDDGWTETNGKVIVVLPNASNVVYGERLDLKGKLAEPENTAKFDYRSYLARQGIHYQIRYPQIIARQHPSENDFLASLYSLKNRIAHGLDLSLPEPPAALSKGILLGIRTSLPEELRSAFARTNTTHILAISGWNITMIAGLLRVVGGRVFGRIGLTLFVIGGIALYTVLIGPQASVLRAAIMGAMLLFGAYFGRPSDTVVGLLFAATAMTIFDPLYLWDVGFQLSFASTLGITLLVPRLQHLLRFLPMWLSDAASVTLAAQLATLPIMVVVFGELSIVTILANALVLPATLPIMLLTALTALSAMIWLPLAQIIGLADWAFLTYMIRVLEYLASLSWASISIGQLSPLLALPYYALVAVLLTNKSVLPRQIALPVQSVSARTKLTLGALSVCAVLPLAAFLNAPDNRTHISFLDVGQGDAILVQTPMGHKVLIDGGPSGPKLLDALGRRMAFWDRSIDLVVLTHANDDHLAGLVEALDRLDVRQILEPRTSAESTTYRRWRQVIDQKGAVRTEAAAGQEISVEPGVTLHVLHPMGEVSFKSANESSIVLKLNAGTVGVTFTGDVDRGSQHEMAQSGFDLSSAVLKVPHHGARGAVDDAFLNAVKPSVAVISVGQNNRFGHPATETLDQLGDVHVLRTDLDGTIEVIIGDGKYEVRVER